MTAIDSDPPTLVHDEPGEQCTHCGAPLAADQRYCLNCGTRRAERRVPVGAIGAPAALPLPPGGGGIPVRTVVEPMPTTQRLGGAWGVAALLLVALGVGVIIGSLGDDDAPVAAAPPVVTVASGTTGTTAAAPEANTSPAADEWPDQDGFTVQLGELPKEGTDQSAADAAKAAATAKGAGAPGILDAGAHGLTAGQLVLYSGVFETKAEATSALDGLKAAYPEARVIEVKSTASAADVPADAGADAGADDAAADAAPPPATVSKDALQQKENLAPDDFQKQSKKLPKTTGTEGAAPETDNAAPGGGGEAESIG